MTNIDENEEEEEVEQERIEKLAEDKPDMKGKKVLSDMIDEMENKLKDNGLGNANFDTGILIDPEFNSIQVKNGKIVFGDGHSLDWALDHVSPFQLVDALQMAKMYVDGFINLSKEPSKREKELTDLGNILG